MSHEIEFVQKSEGGGPYYGLCDDAGISYFQYTPIAWLYGVESASTQTLILPNYLLCLGFHSWNAQFSHRKTEQTYDHTILSPHVSVGCEVYGFDLWEEDLFQQNTDIICLRTQHRICQSPGLQAYLEESLGISIPTALEAFRQYMEGRVFAATNCRDTRDTAMYGLCATVSFPALNKTKTVKNRLWSSLN